LDNPGVKAGKGRFTGEDLSGIWEAKGYEKQVQKKLLALMMQFELCYQVDKGLNNVFIVPEMLADMAPENYKWPVGNDLSLFYRYDFMPRGLLTRLIVRLHAYIFVHDNKQCVWKTGVKIDGLNLGCPETFAEIIETWDNRQLSIRVQGMFAKDLMSKITFQIDALNNDFFKQLAGREKNQQSSWHKMIPCICQTCRHTPDKYFYDFNVLIKARGKGKDIQCQKSFDNVQVKDLLDGVFARETTDQHTVFQNRVKKPRRIFISYSRKDEHWKYELSSHLASLRGQGLISEWNDRNIESGPWSAQLEHAINNTDIFILLVTKNFISSSYITSVEIKRAYSLYKSGNAMIFPVICDACDWQLLAVTKDEKEFNPEENREMFVWLGKFQAFPRNNKPLKNWDNPQDGLLEVVNELKKCL
jgi:internalin A